MKKAGASNEDVGIIALTGYYPGNCNVFFKRTFIPAASRGRDLPFLPLLVDYSCQNEEAYAATWAKLEGEVGLRSSE